MEMSNPDISNPTTWKSLFLPLNTDERVIFSSFFAPLQRNPSFRIDDLNYLHVVNDRDNQREAVLCVMENQAITIFDMMSSQEGPTRMTSFSAPKEMKQSISDSSSDKVVATCASLVPVELLYAIRQGSNHALAAHGGHDEHYEPPAVQHSDQATPTKIFRGVVGSSNGRIDVFTETSFAFGFPAHKCPVAHVQALFVGESVQSPPVPETNGSRTNNSMAVQPNVVPRADMEPRQETFASMSNLMGFLTMGCDGVVFVWRRRAEGYRREKLVEPSMFSKCHAIHAAFPFLYRPLYDATAASSPSDVGDAQNQEGGVLFSPSTPGRSAPAANTLNSEPSLNSSMSCASLIFSGGNGFSNTVKIRSCETMKEVERDVALDGIFVRTTAITVDGSMCLVAREKVVYAVDYEARTCKRVLTSTSGVKQLALTVPIGVAGCESGKIYVFHSDTGAILGTYYTYSGEQVVSLSFVYSAMLMTIVDATQCVEIVELPEEFLRQSSKRRATMYDAQHCAAYEVLSRFVQLQECSTGIGSAAIARTSIASEQLLLSRFLVPESVTQYLSKQHHLL